jgi:hypothetical protein
MLQQPAVRRFPRVKAERPVLLRRLGEEEPFEAFVKTHVIGLGGCMFVSREPLGFGSLMELLISVEGRVLRTDGRVAYELRKGEEHQVGVEFLRIAPADRAVLESLVARAEQRV